MHRPEIIQFSTTKSSSQCGFACGADGCTAQPVCREREEGKGELNSRSDITQGPHPRYRRVELTVSISAKVLALAWLIDLLPERLSSVDGEG